MPRRALDVDAFRSALAHELASVSPRPGGWERVRDSLERPRAAWRPWRLFLLLLAAPLVAGTLMVGGLAPAGAAPSWSPPGQAVEGPPLSAVGAVLAAITVPITVGEIRRPSVRRTCGLRARPG
jgi:hypothetical protein